MQELTTEEMLEVSGSGGGGVLIGLGLIALAGMGIAAYYQCDFKLSAHEISMSCRKK
jgi:hypothetical protein